MILSYVTIYKIWIRSSYSVLTVNFIQFRVSEGFDYLFIQALLITLLIVVS